VLEALATIGGTATAELLTSRYARLRHIGTYTEAGVHASEPLAPSLRHRIGRILRLPGVPRRPRWSEIWPSGDDGADAEDEP